MSPPRILAPLALAVLLLAACGDTVIDSGTESRTIRVSGRGEVRAEPDIARIHAGVEVRADTVTEARAGAAEAARAVIAALHTNGVAERDIQTVAFSIYATYDYREDPPRISGYAVSNSVEATVRNIGRVGEIIDAVAAAGGNAVRFDGIAFAHEDARALAETARELAIEDARARATQLATLTGVTLGEPISIVETSRDAPLVAVSRADFAMAADSDTPVAAGTSAVSVTVDVTWAIE